MKRRVVTGKRILILCEGVTEEVYAKSLRTHFLTREMQRVVTVEVVRHKKNDPLNLLLEAKERLTQAKREKQPFSTVWIFLDHDNSPHLDVVFREIQKYGYSVAFSAISIEFWFLLHFENSGKAFSNSSECIKHLNKYWPNYHKTKLNHFKELGGYLDIAIKRAEALEKRSAGVPLEKVQPITTVHHLVTFFKKLN